MRCTDYVLALPTPFVLETAPQHSFRDMLSTHFPHGVCDRQACPLWEGTAADTCPLIACQASCCKAERSTWLSWPYAKTCCHSSTLAGFAGYITGVSKEQSKSKSATEALHGKVQQGGEVWSAGTHVPLLCDLCTVESVRNHAAMALSQRHERCRSCAC